MENILATVASTPPDPSTRAEAHRRLVTLLADFVGCVLSSAGRPGPSAFAADGIAGTVAQLALRAGGDDRDDVDWRSLHHPGSVVWPVVLALGAAQRVPGDGAVDAARHGYAAAATVADVLGPGHRALWHVTATAGAIGAASAASVLLGLDVPARSAALALAAANAGGLARAAHERRGAATFNRAAAAALGLAASRAAAAGAVPVDDPVAGPGGMIVAMSGTPAPDRLRLRDGLADAAPRLLPASGFLQSVATGVARARALLDGDLTSVRVGLTAGALPLVDGDDAGPWWDARTVALRAWAAGDAYAVDMPGPLDDRTDLVHLEPADVRVGHAHVTVTTDRGQVDLEVAPTTSDDPDLVTAVHHKWARVLGREADRLDGLARSALDPAGSPAALAWTWAS